ncbi:MAG: cytochrome-c peroxidase [Planctomycetia bacterium]
MLHSLRRGMALLLASALAVSIAERVAGDEPTSIVKVPPRAERTPAERTALARRLRQAYAAPPAAWPTPHVDPGVEWRELGLLPAVEHPRENPYSAAKAALGRALFFDPRLSASGHMACATCHDPDRGWADGRAVSLTHGTIPARNTPTIRNVAFQRTLFWDGRAVSLEAQAAEALANPHEMAGTPEHVIDTIAITPRYREWYAEAFPERPFGFTAVAEALACFERTVVGGRSRFDDFLRGKVDVLSDTEVLGLDLFRREGRCLNCHHGPTLSDGRFHDLGLSFHGRSNEDLGRFRITHDPADKGRFRTPSLRDVTNTAPFMHTGAFSLQGVLNMYNAGMATLKRQPFERDDPTFPVKSPLLKPLGLNRQDLADLEAFLGALAEPTGPARTPAARDSE